MPRFSPLVLALGVAFTGVVLAQDPPSSSLPDIGSSAGELLSPAEEAMYGEMTLRELRHYELLVEDPLLNGYLQTLGYRLAAQSERPEQSYTFFLLRSREINAFATLGGYVGFNAGLFLMAEREDEIAAVLAHEIVHVTQRHVLRGVERAQKDSIPIMLAMLGALVAAQSAGGDGDATQAVLAGGMGIMQQRQINYTRSNEHEADRLGIQTLSRAGYDPLAMADVFARMERTLRGNQGGWQAPEYLRTHPVSTTRISEAKDRARRLKAEATGGTACVRPPEGGAEQCEHTELESFAYVDRAPINPLLPHSLVATTPAAPAQADAAPDTNLFAFARERLRVLSAESWSAAVAEYDRMRRAAPDAFDDASRYGQSIALSHAGQTATAARELDALASRHPSLYWISLAQAENDHRGGNPAAAARRFESLLRDLPRNRAVILGYAENLIEIGTSEAGRKAQDLMRPLLAESGRDAGFQRSFARASELAGDLVRAGEAHAEHAYLTGRPEDALRQLERLKHDGALDYYQRARIDARIAAITPTVLELRRRGVRPGERGQRLEDGASAWSIGADAGPATGSRERR